MKGWVSSLGVLVISIGGITVVFSYPRFKDGEFGGIIHIGPGILALYKVCPHLGCLYSWNDQEIKFICPCHGSQYENDGDYISGPSPRSLDHFAIHIVDPSSGEELVSNVEEGGALRLPENSDAIVLIDTGNKFLGQKHN